MNNINLKLPYIETNNEKYLIDTGSTKTLINDKIYNRLKKYAISIPFKIKTAHGITNHNEAVYCKIPKIFNTNMKHTFHKFNFSKDYDGLIGVDLLEKLEAVLDLHNRKLITKYGKIPITYNSKRITFEPLSKQKITIDCKEKDGFIHIPEFSPGKGLRVEDSVVPVKDYKATLCVINYLETKRTINFCDALDTDVITEFEELYHYDPTPYMNKNDLPYLQEENIRNNLNTDGLNIEEKACIEELIRQYKHIFYVEGQPLSFTHCVKHKLNLKDKTPVYVKMYRQPIETKKEIKKQVQNLLDQDIIQNSISPWSCPVNIVTRTINGKTKKRMVLDYRRLNDQLIEDKYPIPNITDILEKLGRCHYFSSIDLANGYHQVEMDPEDIEKTAFSTEQGHFEFKRMPFGLKNAPATFQRLMDNILRGLQEDTCMTYLDDIIVYSVSLKEHLQKLKKVFDRLAQANFKIKLEKCDFLKKELKYLGHVISEDGVKPNPEKIEAITKFPIPTTTKEIKSFLGLVGYYRKFIRDFAKITKPLTSCLKKGAKITLSEEYKNAFEKCKTLLCNEPILQYPDFTKEFIITTDASNVALGAVLSQGNLPNDRPVQYASRTLSETEQKYSTIEKELLAIIYAVKTFRPYIYGRKFLIYTDHRPLVWLWKLKEPNSKLLRWKLRLEEYDFEVIYKKGKYNLNADTLSRIKIDVNVHDDLDSVIAEVDESREEEIREIIEELKNYPNTTFRHSRKTGGKNLAQMQQNEENTELILPEERPRDIDDTIHSNQNIEPARAIEISDTPISNKKKQYIIKPSFGGYEVETKIEEGCKIITAKIPFETNEGIILQFLKEYISDKGNQYIYFESEKMYQDFSNVYVKHFNNKGPRMIRCTTRVTVVKDIDDQLELVALHHVGKTNHRGIDETTEYLKRKYYWKNMKDTITNYIKSCEICNTSKYDRHPSKPHLQLTKTPDRPFRKLFIDTFTIQTKKYLTIIDAFSRLGQAIPIASSNATEVADALLEYFKYYGIPEEINCDSGKEFKNDLIKSLLESYKIGIHFGTPMNPCSQGSVERFHSTIIEHIRCLQSKKQTGSIDTLMKNAIIAYNNSISRTTGCTPFEVTYGHTALRDPMELLYSKDYFHQYIQDHKDRLKILYDRIKTNNEIEKTKYTEKSKEKAKVKPFQINEKVYIRNNTRNKLSQPYSGPYVITKINEDGTAVIKTKTSERRVPIKRLKHSIIPDVPASSTSDISSTE